MELFSQRQGYKPAKMVMQLEYIDDDLRNNLWNALYIHYWYKVAHTYLRDEPELHQLCIGLWLDYFKLPLDDMPQEWNSVSRFIRSYFFTCEWFEVYDFVEFVANHHSDDSVNGRFTRFSNAMLERELSGYRFIGGKIAPITSKEEIAEIGEALATTSHLTPIHEHLETALALFSDKKSPDYRNSVKESISAVEAICRVIMKSDKATLSQALKTITGKIELHPALQQSFNRLYGYTSDADGIRHSLLEQSSLDFEDAKFMLVSCSAFINYLKVKASKAGIELEKK